MFKVQDAQELNDPEKVSSRWVKHLYGLVDELNDTETEMIGMKSKDAIKLKEVPLVTRESYPPEEVLPEDGLYRYILQPGEEHDDQRRRATDRIWSKASYRLREIVENPGNRVMYYLLDGPERAFVSEELMLIPEDTELPPDYVQADLMGCEMGKVRVVMNKPVYLDQAILDLSKTIMYEFHYDYMIPKYGDRLKLCYMDTDSLIYSIKTKDFYSDI